MIAGTHTYTYTSATQYQILLHTSKVVVDMDEVSFFRTTTGATIRVICMLG